MNNLTPDTGERFGADAVCFYHEHGLDRKPMLEDIKKFSSALLSAVTPSVNAKADKLIENQAKLLPCTCAQVCINTHPRIPFTYHIILYQ